MVAHAFELPSQRPVRKQKEETECSEPSTPDSLRRSRRHSTPILSFTSSPAFSSGPTPAVTPNTDFQELRRGDQLTPQLGRLRLVDYLIKPVQRICKYPLLLDQLKMYSIGDALVGVEEACAAMRAVVSLVDNASMKQAHSVKSALIVSRIAPALHMRPSSPGSSSQEEKPSTLTAEFLGSLGACLLSGALDVVHHPSSRARYLGAFLYVGGYMVMVKVPKGGKVYEPKYWFSLSCFELIDDEDDDGKHMLFQCLVGRF